jgi:hypothetical protein
MSEQAVALQGEIVLTDDDLIAGNQNIRQLLVREMIANGIPTDNKERYLLLTALGDSDRTALAQKKIGSTEKQGAADRQAALMIAEMAKRYGSASPFQAPGQLGRIPVIQAGQLDGVELVPGETDIGTSSETYDSFMERLEGPGSI